MPKLLSRRVIGDPILRQIARKVSRNELSSPEIAEIISDMQHTLRKKKYGIALAAPQVGHSLAIAVLDLKPTPTRPELEPYEVVLINPVINKYAGNTVMLRDGCVSIGAEDDPIYGWSERRESVEVEWLDEKGNKQKQTFVGMLAHVMQHEIDHLNGVLFIDRVKDSKTYTTASEYKKTLEKS